MSWLHNRMNMMDIWSNETIESEDNMHSIFQPTVVIFSSTVLLLLSISILYKHRSLDNNKDEVENDRTRSYYNIVESKSTKPKPYSYFNNPNRPLIDKIIGLIFPRIIPVAKCANYTNFIHDQENMTQDETEMLSFVNDVRQRQTKLGMVDHYRECKKWNTLVQQYSNSNNAGGNKDYLVGGTVLFPRHSNILADWHIVNYNYRQRSTCSSSSNGGDNISDPNFVDVEFVCPVSLIQGSYHIENENDCKSKGYKTIATTHFKDLKIAHSSEDLEYFIYFHGGGMVVGPPRDGLVGFANIVSLIEMRCKISSKCPKAVFLSVNYDLAPEYIFPAPVIDCLSVSKHVMEHCGDSNSSTITRSGNNVHFVGPSAGGNLASVVGFESFRYYENNGNSSIKSIVCIDPFLLPLANTNSYYMNSLYCPICPVELLRWFWGTYLQLRHTTHDGKGSTDDNSKNDNKIDFYSMQSYSQAVTQCKWIQQDSNFARLITPQVDLPPKIVCENNNNGHDNTKLPTIIVTSSKGDALYDDGVDLVHKLKANGNITNVLHFEGKGSHVLSLVLNPDMKKRFIQAWHNAIWRTE